MRLGIGISIGRRRGGAQGPNGTPGTLTLAVVSTTENKLDWLNNATDEDFVILQRSDDGGSYSDLAQLTSGTITYNDTTAIVGYLHYYRIVLIKGVVYSAYSNAVNNLTGDTSTGKVGEWLMNETSGTTVADTGGANNGTAVGTTIVPGKIGNARNFNGVANTDVVNLGDILDTTFAGANKKFTITAWIKPAATMTAHAIVYKLYGAPDNQRQFAFMISTGSKLRFLWYGDLAGTTYRSFIGSTTSITDTGKYYHVVATYDGSLTQNSRAALFIDAVSEAGSINATAGTPTSIPDGTTRLAIGASLDVAGTTSANNFNGIIDSVRIYNRILSYADILSDKYDGYPVPQYATSKLFNYNAGQEDVFLDELYIGVKTGSLISSVNKPVKYSGNPLFLPSGANNDTWDADKEYSNIIKIGNTYHCWYTALGISGPPGFYLTAYATSSDGLTWIKPNLGLVTYGGNTNNNLIIGDGAFGICVTHNPDLSADLLYVATLANNAGAGGIWEANRYITVYKSANGLSFTQIAQFRPVGNPYLECSQIVRRADGKWIIYYIWYGLVDLRRVGAFLSDTTDPAGIWTDQGTILATTLTTDQKYALNIQLIDGVYYGIVERYNSTTGIIWFDLYVSRDGLIWVKKVTQWLQNGIAGQWDAGLLLGGRKSYIHEGNNWRIYYTATKEDHAHAVPRDGRLGFATIGYKRIGGITGSGTFITTAFTPTAPLLINADLTHGTLKVELLLAADNSVIAGYSKDDMDAIGAIDTYSTEVKWGGNSILTDRSLKIKFYLT